MMETQDRRMTTEEVGLLKELVRWRRNRGGVTVGSKGYGHIKLADGRTLWWQTRLCMNWPHRGEIGVHESSWRPPSWHQVESVTQAVDIVVALGYLPQRFSSAYRAGWNASAVWHGSDDYHVPTEEFQRLFHNPDNISFPVGDHR